MSYPVWSHLETTYHSIFTHLTPFYSIPPQDNKATRIPPATHQRYPNTQRHRYTNTTNNIKYTHHNRTMSSQIHIPMCTTMKKCQPEPCKATHRKST